MQPLAYTTSKISWKILYSAIVHARKLPENVSVIDLNLETLSSIILSCTALEAFVNEISSLTNAFLFEFEQEYEFQNLEASQQESVIGVRLEKCQEVVKIKDNSEGSFYERYKLLLKALGVENPPFLQKLSDLKNVRDGLVHFKMLDIPVISNSNGIIVYEQKQPDFFKHLKGYSVNKFPIVAKEGSDGSIEWTLRISTNAMAIWCIDLTLEAIIYTLDVIPNGKLKDFFYRAYASNEKPFVHVFQKGKSEVKIWTDDLFNK